MKKLFLLITLILSGCSLLTVEKLPEIKPIRIERIANQSQIPCIDTLGAAKFPRELQAIPLNYAIGVFANTFGDAFPVVKKEIDRGRVLVRVNLLWSDSHSYGDKDIPFIIKESKRYGALCSAHPERLVVEIAPFTEHNLRNPDKYLNIVKANAPNCGVVNSVWNGSLTKDPRFKNEVHGAHAPPNIAGVAYNYSYDGTSSVDSDVTKMLARHSNAKLFCMWHPRLNGKWSMKDSTPRPQRMGWPSGDLLRSLVYLFSEKGFVSLPKKWLVKSHADNHGPADTKGDKLLVISPIKASQIILKRAGQKIGTLDFYGSFEGGGFRYYAKVMGYKLGATLDMFINGRGYGTINGGFRAGSFREK